MLTNNVILLFGQALFFLMLFVPTAYAPVKGALLFVILASIAFLSYRHRAIELHPTVVRWTAIMVATGIGFMGWGFIESHGTAALRVGTVYVLWPLVYAMLVAGSANPNRLEGFLKVLVFATIAIGLYSLSYILYASGWLPEAFYIPLDQGQALNPSPDSFEYNLYSISSLLFLVPFSITAILVWPKGKAAPVALLWNSIAFALGIALVFLSGRRGLWLTVSVAPLIALVSQFFLLPSHRLPAREMGKRIMLLMLITLTVYATLHSIVGIGIKSGTTYFLSGFQFASPSAATSPFLRSEQFYNLLHGWQESPFFGAGLGTSAPGNLRSDNQPWSYELSYMALLYHTGLVGTLIYAAAVMWIFWMGLKIIRSSHPYATYLLPILVGSASFLIANGTNPYLEKFDYLWVIFLPVAFINHWLLSQKKRAAAIPDSGCKSDGSSL